MPTLTAYPAAGSGGTTCDGRVYRGAAVNEPFATIVAGAGSVAELTGSSTFFGLWASSTTDQFNTLARMYFTFDTSAIGAGSTIASGSFSLYGQGTKNVGIGTQAYHVCQSTQASNGTLVTGDYGNVGSTSFGSVSNASWSTSAYNAFTLNASGLSNVSKTSISKFAARGEWDINGSFTGTWSSGAQTTVSIYCADQAGTTNDPKLDITYTTGSVSLDLGGPA